MIAVLDKSPFAARLAVVFLLQAAAIGWIVFDRVAILRGGAEIRLQARPIDPRDLFRGEYVTLGFEISELRPAALNSAEEFEAGERLFVGLQTDEEGTWAPVSVAKSLPSNPAGNRRYIAGRVVYAYPSAPPRESDSEPPCPDPCTTLAIEYGIESYFVPEGQGKELEAARDDSKVEVLVAVTATGRAAIKGLIVDGTLRYEEPLL